MSHIPSAIADGADVIGARLEREIAVAETLPEHRLDIATARGDLAGGVDENAVLGKERAEGGGIPTIEGIEIAHVHGFNLSSQNRAVFRVGRGDRQQRNRTSNDQGLAPGARDESGHIALTKQRSAASRMPHNRSPLGAVSITASLASTSQSPATPRSSPWPVRASRI